ncbi:putative ABC transport system permease protein [Chryseolinea serpens]|uniref:Putative ABC transport system permease protein n=1 Tax=Chryseolinea serpens TaxID=947013 RepID=A0A1M5MAW2_9BACT|nr:ABC transporter permease [Chryseolinea serpens]SHG73843.1 putative ABC transport system permease protein [Chryseolinea serpens]
MIKNFLLITVRAFRRNVIFSLINVIGLAIGIATSSLIFMYVFDELTYDTIHPRHNALYSLGGSITDKNGNRESFGAVPGGYPRELKAKFGSIESYTRLLITGFPHSLHDKQTDKIILNQDGELYWVEQSLGDVLYVKMIDGANPSKALEHINSMIISRSAAKALFGDQPAVDKLLTIKHPFTTFGKDVEYQVTGVFEDYPANTFFRPKFLLNMNGLKTTYESSGANFADAMESNGLAGNFFFTFLYMPNGAPMDAMSEELKRLALITQESDSAFRAEGNKIGSVIRPFDDMHFDSQINWAVFEAPGNLQTVYTLSVIGVLILVIASINYMNLATARAGTRGKEVGLRKTLGSRRRDIAFQFILESGLNTGLSLLLALIFIVIALPYFNQIADKHFEVLSLFNLHFILGLLGIVLVVTVLGGSYPAFYLSGFRPTEVLKGKGVGKGSELLRRALVTFQFAAAVILSVSSIVILGQMDFIQQSKLNENGQHILSVRFGTVAPNEKYPALKNELLQDKDLAYVTMSNHLPRHDYFGGMDNTFRFTEIDDKEYQWARMSTDFDFCKAFNLQIVAGRDFDNSIPSDSNTVLLNEKAVKVLNKTNENILGMQVDNVFMKTRSTVIGVVKDFPFQSAYHAINPLVISPRLREQDRILYVRLPEKGMAGKVRAIEETWKKVMPGVGFDYWFIDDEFRKLYKKENQVSGLAKWFSLLSLCITILGLYGFSSFMAEQKTREIGIRKSLGASSRQIVVLLITTFLKMFAVAMLIALPVTWYFNQQWLNTFTFRIGLTATPFIAGAGLVFLLMIFTVGYELLKASKANPIKALKHE